MSIEKSCNLGSYKATGSSSCSKGPTDPRYSETPWRESPARAYTHTQLSCLHPLFFLSIWNVSGNFSYKGITDAQWENLTYPFRKQNCFLTIRPYIS